MCAITDKLVEDSEEGRWEDVETTRMQDSAKRLGSVDTAKKRGGESDVEDLENRYPKSTAHGVPSNDESGVGGRSTITSDGTAAKESNRPRSNMLQEYGKRHLARTRGDAAPLSRMLIRNDYASSVISLRILPSLPAKWHGVVLACTSPSVPLVYVVFAKRVRQATFEISAMNG